MSILRSPKRGGEKFILCAVSSECTLWETCYGKGTCQRFHPSNYVLYLLSREGQREGGWDREREGGRGTGGEKKKTDSKMNQVCRWEERYCQHHHFNSKRLPVLSLFIKCPITEHVLPWWIINYRSTSWAIYSWPQPANTLNWCSLALNQSSCSKRDLHISHRCLAPRRMASLASLSLCAKAEWSTAARQDDTRGFGLSRTSGGEHKEAAPVSDNCTCNAGKDFADSYQHILRHLPPYWQICHVVGNVAKHLVNGAVWGLDDLQPFGFQYTWEERRTGKLTVQVKKKKTNTQRHTHRQ